MTDTRTDPNAPSAAPIPASDPAPEAFDDSTGGAPFDPQRRATELAILDALRAVVDPEIGMNVVELALIQQVKDQAESVVEHDVKVTLLAERWDPRDAGLMW
jgi:hypothetical protein